MSELINALDKIISDDVRRIIVSNPIAKDSEYRKIVIENKVDSYQIAKYTDKQVFHENVEASDISERVYELTDSIFKQVNAISDTTEHIILISKKGKVTYKTKALKTVGVAKADISHNRKKNYIFNEGMDIPPLVDMGIFTKEGKIVNSMYDKFKQINRFIEIIDDEVSRVNPAKLNVIDFGCGKSYLTFLLYYYLVEIKGIDASIIGLDLKEAVIDKCNKAAENYNYKNLRFELGDINGYDAPFDVDMVVTLHACDTATDYALYNAIQWNAKVIFSVPCCQHELNKQMKTDGFTILSRYGIVKERFAALATDAVRGNLLEYAGYKTNLMEFVDLSHTPKNILIRATKRATTTKAHKEKALNEIKSLMEEFAFEPTLYKLMKE